MPAAHAARVPQIDQKALGTARKQVGSQQFFRLAAGTAHAIMFAVLHMLDEIMLHYLDAE